MKLKFSNFFISSFAIGVVVAAIVFTVGLIKEKYFGWDSASDWYYDYGLILCPPSFEFSALEDVSTIIGRLVAYIVVALQNGILYSVVGSVSKMIIQSLWKGKNNKDEVGKA